MKHIVNGQFHNMTKIKIKHLDIHNFLSFQDEEWDFDGTSRLVLIKGVNKDNWQASGEASNGSGKSAWSHALMYALFGQLSGKVHNSNLKNKYSDTVSQSGYKMSVDVEVDTEVSGSTRHWKIVRGIQKSQTVVLQLFTMDDGDWKDISKSTSANTQKFIEDNVLFMNFEMYQRLVMLSLDDKYIFFKLNASQKRDFVETMFDTSVYSNMYRMMSEDLKTRNIILQNLKVNQVKLEKSRELCEDEISRYKAGVNDKIVETTEERDSLQQKISTFDPKFKEIEVRQKAIEDAMAKIRRMPSFRALIEDEDDDDKALKNTRLLGRSVWNTKWVMIIPAGQLLGGESEDRMKAIATFINGMDTDRDGTVDAPGVSDIQLGFKTYSNSGN